MNPIGGRPHTRRRRPVAVDWVDGATTINCPSLLGAIIAKAACSQEIVAIGQILNDPIHPARRFAVNFDDVADLADQLVNAK